VLQWAFKQQGQQERFRALILALIETDILAMPPLDHYGKPSLFLVIG
jgi:hypothetical protein